MGINERREREREQRRTTIVAAAWGVANDDGWGAFAMSGVAARAELGRATLYAYFRGVEELVATMADEAITTLRAVHQSVGIRGSGLREALRKENPAAAALLFPLTGDSRPSFNNRRMAAIRARARKIASG